MQAGLDRANQPDPSREIRLSAHNDDVTAHDEGAKRGASMRRLCLTGVRRMSTATSCSSRRGYATTSRCLWVFTTAAGACRGRLWSDCAVGGQHGQITVKTGNAFHQTVPTRDIWRGIRVAVQCCRDFSTRPRKCQRRLATILRSGGVVLNGLF